MNSVSPGTGANRPRAQSSAACTMRTRRDETKIHHMNRGQAWTDEEVAIRKAMIERAGLTWDVVESIAVPEAIAAKCTRDSLQFDAKFGGVGQDLFAALVRQVDRIDASYRV